MIRTVITSLLILGSCFARDFESPKKTRFIELYSSQGCHSCPPAERWIGQLANDPNLWKENIPIVFHVDYWNYLGWKDPFASKDNTNRQRKYGSTGAVKSIYTPGFLVNGQEWKDYFRGRKLPEAKALTGKIKVSIKEKIVTVHYNQSMNGKRFQARLIVHGVETKVLRGENGGRRFTEDFIAFQTATSTEEKQSWSFSFPKTALPKAKGFALIIWVEDKKTQAPLQAAGSWIDSKLLF